MALETWFLQHCLLYAILIWLIILLLHFYFDIGVLGVLVQRCLFCLFHSFFIISGNELGDWAGS
jgi:hypothetical protein